MFNILIMLQGYINSTANAFLTEFLFSLTSFNFMKETPHTRFLYVKKYTNF